MSETEIRLKCLELALQQCLSEKKENPILIYEVKMVAQEYLKFATKREDKSVVY